MRQSKTNNRGNNKSSCFPLLPLEIHCLLSTDNPFLMFWDLGNRVTGLPGDY